MERLLEPELMIDAEQVSAYAQADFAIPHNDFIKRLESFVNEPAFSRTALDLGGGPGDISRRFAEAFPLSKVHAVDGSMPMISYGESALSAAQASRIRFIHGRLPDVVLPQSGYAVIFSNSLLQAFAESPGIMANAKKIFRTGRTDNRHGFIASSVDCRGSNYRADLCRQ